MARLAEASESPHYTGAIALEIPLSGAPLLAGRSALLTGQVISVNDEPVQISYQSAIYVIDWDYDETDESKTRIYYPEPGKVRFVLFNSMKSFGVFYTFDAGILDGKAIELRLFVHGIGTPKKGNGRLINYTLAYTAGEAQ